MPRYMARSQSQTSRTMHTPSGPVRIRAKDAAAKALRGAWDADMWTSDGQCEGRTVHDDGGWSEDQPTGLLDAQGNMIYRLATRIGFMAED